MSVLCKRQLSIREFTYKKPRTESEKERHNGENVMERELAIANPPSSIYMITGVTQGNKTESTLRNLEKRFRKAALMNKSKTDNEHRIALVFTDCSIQQTEQFKVRAGNKFNDKVQQDVFADSENTSFKSWVFSSSKDSDKCRIDGLIVALLDAEPHNLPDMLIMCCHPTRVANIQQLITYFDGGQCNMKEGKLKFDIYMDEVDKHCGHLRTVLQSVLCFPIVDQLYLITATPYQNIWTILEEEGISSCQCVQLGKDDPVYQCVVENDNYRKLSDHTACYLEENLPPVEYAHAVLCTLPKLPETNQSGRIIFAPAQTQIMSHNEMELLFLHIGFTVYKSNGKFKGFSRLVDTGNVTKQIERTSIDKYRNQFGLRGELREVFAHWKMNNMKENLAITGLKTISRGVTFNTTGFQFTDMIISPYHARNLAELLQLLGRGTGSKTYVGTMTIHCPKKILNKAIEMQQISLGLIKSRPESMSFETFRQASDREHRTQRLVAAIDEKIFDSTTAAQAFLDRLISQKPRKRKINLSKLPQNNGFFVTKNKDYYPDNPPLPLQAQMTPQAGSFMGMKMGYTHGLAETDRNRIRVFPVYMDTSDVDSLLWNVRYFTKNYEV